MNLPNWFPSQFNRKAIAVGAAVLLGAGLLLPGKNPAGAGPAATVNTVVELSPADVATVQTQTLTQRIPLSGTLQAMNQTTLSAEVEAVVAEVLVRPGDAVRKGQVLLRFDQRDIQERVKTQEAQLASAKAQLELARSSYQRSQDLLKQNYVSQNSFDTAGQSLKSAEAGVEAAQAQLAIARKALQSSEVRAPFSAYVSERLVQPGQRVGMVARLVSLVDLAHLELEGQVPVAYVPRLKLGQSIRFQAEGFDQREFKGQLVRLNPAASTGSRTLPVYAEVHNPDGALKAGMFVSGDLSLNEATNALVLNSAAVRQDGGSNYVLVIRNNKLVRQEVLLGLRDDKQGLVQIQNGLAMGEQAVLAKLSRVAAGQTVKVQAKAG